MVHFKLEPSFRNPTGKLANTLGTYCFRSWITKVAVAGILGEMVNILTGSIH